MVDNKSQVDGNLAGKEHSHVLGDNEACKNDNKKTIEPVDLGLSVLWADCNLFAKSESEKGIPYSWGGITQKIDFRRDNSIFTRKIKSDLQVILGNEDLSICGNVKYDAAKSVLGEFWRLPQRFEFEELLEKCNWQWLETDGKRGYKVTGPSGKSIFLPATGKKVVEETKQPESGYYWSGIANKDVLGEESLFLFFDKKSKTILYNGERWNGMAIRPVYSTKKDIIEQDGFSLSLFGTKLIKSNDREDCYVPRGVKVICTNSFKGANNVKNIFLPDSVEEIEDYAFSSLNIVSVYIPGSIKKVGKNAFYMCGNLKKVIIEEGISNLGVNMFDGCKSIEHIAIPNSIEYLPDGIFSGCESLIHIQLPSNIYYIGMGAFYGCSLLQSIHLPKSLVGLSDDTFSYCMCLQSVEIPEGVVAISSNCFRGCMSLLKITIPATLQHIDRNAFGYDVILEVPMGMKSRYIQMNLDSVQDIIEYNVTIPQNIEELKQKSEDFIASQQAKREEIEYLNRTEADWLFEDDASSLFEPIED